MAERWILLRGLARESGHWGTFPEVFLATCPEVVPLCLDLPGNGTEFRARTPLSIRGILEALRRRVPAGEPPPFVLAISLGAMVAMEWAALYPEELAGLVLVSPSAGRLSPLHQRLCWEALPLLARAFFSPPGARERWILRLTSNQRDFPGGLLEKWIAIQGRHPVSRWNAFRQFLAAARYTLPFGPPRVPVLLLHSLGDKLVAPECGFALSRQWRASLETHAHAGHDLPLDDPRWVAEKIAAWRRGLSELSGGRARA